MDRLQIGLSLSETGSLIGSLDNAITMLDSAQNSLQSELDCCVTDDTYTSLLEQSDAIFDHKKNLSNVLSKLNNLVG